MRPDFHATVLMGLAMSLVGILAAGLKVGKWTDDASAKAEGALRA